MGRFCPGNSRGGRGLNPAGREALAFLAAQLGKRDVAVLVADENGDVIGYAYAAVEGYDYMSLRGPAGVVHDILVDPESRGRGVGRRLLDAALAFLKARAARRPHDRRGE